MRFVVHIMIRCRSNQSALVSQRMCTKSALPVTSSSTSTVGIVYGVCCGFARLHVTSPSIVYVIVALLLTRRSCSKTFLMSTLLMFSNAPDFSSDDAHTFRVLLFLLFFHNIAALFQLNSLDCMMIRFLNKICFWQGCMYSTACHFSSSCLKTFYHFRTSKKLSNQSKHKLIIGINPGCMTFKMD